jgi:hypothetical protein
MKKIKIISMIVLLLIAAQSIVSAGSFDDVFTGASFSVLKEYTGDEAGAYQMRGFTVSPDGKYLYGGLLQNDKKVIKIDSSNGYVIGEYKDSVEPVYPKGLAADDRNYLYVGIANQANDGAVRFSIVNAETMAEEYVTDIEIAGKVGVNGAAVENFNGKYILYFVTNYGPNFIYSYDVTDVKNPVLNAGFGNGGIADLTALIGGTEGSYIDVDSAGNVYLSFNTGGGSKGDALYKIAPDGKSILAKTEIAEAYGVNIVKDEYVLVSTYNGEDSSVYVLNAGDLSEAANIGNMDGTANYSMAAFGGGKIYISDHGYGGSGDRIFVSNALAIPEPVAETEPAAEIPAEAVPAAEEEAPAPVQTAAVTAPATGNSNMILILAGLLSIICAVSLRTRKNRA